MPSTVFAGERYALIVTGASGGTQYAEKYHEWRRSFTAILRDKLRYPADRVVVLAEETEPGVRRATRENVRAAVADFRTRVAPDDLVFIMLIGHGTSQGDEAKFNLVGPDLSAGEWAALIAQIPARVVFVDTSSGSFPFLRALAGPRRVVVTADDTAAQEFETVFPEFFVKAFTDESADQDRNGQISIWEAFTYASAGVRQWFQERADLATERSLLDDTGRGIGREAQVPGVDGAVAQVTYLQPDSPIDAPANSELAGLLKRRADLDAQVQLLRARKANMPPDEYDSTLERLLLEIARLDRQLRAKS